MVRCFYCRSSWYPNGTNQPPTNQLPRTVGGSYLIGYVFFSLKTIDIHRWFHCNGLAPLDVRTSTGEGRGVGIFSGRFA